MNMDIFQFLYFKGTEDEIKFANKKWDFKNNVIHLICGTNNFYNFYNYL